MSESELEENYEKEGIFLQAVAKKIEDLIKERKIGNYLFSNDKRIRQYLFNKYKSINDAWEIYDEDFIQIQKLYHYFEFDDHRIPPSKNIAIYCTQFRKDYGWPFNPVTKKLKIKKIDFIVNEFLEAFENTAFTKKHLKYVNDANKYDFESMENAKIRKKILRKICLLNKARKQSKKDPSLLSVLNSV